MKLPENPTKPYIRHSAHTLRDLKKRDHGTGSERTGAVDRPNSIRSRSARLTCGICSGRLRNHSQNPMDQNRPRLASMKKETAQPGNTLNSQSPIRSGATKPPRRLNVQINP